MNIEIGDYVSFGDDESILYEVIDVDKERGYVKYYQFDLSEPIWERFEYITTVYIVRKKGE